MDREKLEKRREELYEEIQEINDKINKYNSEKYGDYVGRYFKIDDNTEYTIGKVYSYNEYALKVRELMYDLEMEEYTYSLGARAYNELEFITKEEFIKLKFDFVCSFEESFI